MTRLPTVLLMSTLLSSGFAFSAHAQSAPAPQPAPTAPMPQPAAPPPAPPAAQPAAQPAAMAPAVPAAAPVAANDDAKADAARQRTIAADRDAMFDAHLAALHAGLTLTPDQDKLWPPVEQAIRGFVATRTTLRDERGDRMKSRQTAMDHEDPIAALKIYSDGMLERAQALKALSSAVDPLYTSLSDDQKHRLPMLLHGMTPRSGPVARMVEQLDREEEGPRGGHMERGMRHRWDQERFGDNGWNDEGWSGHRDQFERRAGIDGEERGGGWPHHGWDRNPQDHHQPDEGPDAND